MPTLRPTSRIIAVVALLVLALAPLHAQAAPPYQAQEEQFLRLVNTSRKAEGHAALAGTADVALVARNWSKRMAADGNLRHNPNVGEQLPVDWQRWGENVGWASNASGGDLSSVVSRLHQAFLDSPGHRANIMGDFNQVGIGVALGDDGTMWATMVFVQGPITPGSDSGDDEPAAGDPDSGLTDIAGSTHREAINAAYGAGLIKACEGARFCPGRVVSRTELANVMGRMLDLDATTGDHFDDIAAGASIVNTLADAGVVNGCGPRSFCPARPVTRAQLASMFVRGLPDLEPTTTAQGFTDLPADYVHSGAINALAAAGVTRGCRSTSFCPTGKVTRAQLASFAVRALDLS